MPEPPAPPPLKPAPEPAVPRPPSPPWYGGISTLLMLGMIVVLLTYTLLDWDWQQRFGAWNYVLAVALVVASSTLMAHWRADLSRNDED